MVDSGCCKCTVFGADMQSDGLRQAMFLRLKKENVTMLTMSILIWWTLCGKKKLLSKVSRIWQVWGQGYRWVIKNSKVEVMGSCSEEILYMSEGPTQQRIIHGTAEIGIQTSPVFPLLLIRGDLWMRNCIFYIIIFLLDAQELIAF